MHAQLASCLLCELFFSATGALTEASFALLICRGAICGFHERIVRPHHHTESISISDFMLGFLCKEATRWRRPGGPVYIAESAWTVWTQQSAVDGLMEHLKSLSEYMVATYHGIWLAFPLDGERLLAWHTKLCCHSQQFNLSHAWLIVGVAYGVVESEQVCCLDATFACPCEQLFQSERPGLPEAPSWASYTHLYS